MRNISRNGKHGARSAAFGLAAAIGIAALALPGHAQARSHGYLGIGIGGPVYAGPPVYYAPPPPVYYAPPPPVYYAPPPPVYYAPPPPAYYAPPPAYYGAPRVGIGLGMRF